MVWIGLALLPIAYGLGDYLGGLFSQRLSPYAVVGVTSAVSSLGALAWAIHTNSLVFGRLSVGAGAISGLMIVVAYALFFMALSDGKAGIVGAIISLSVIPPVLVDLARGELPSTVSMIGILAIVAGVIVISQPGSLGDVPKRTITIAFASALIFGIQYVALDWASSDNPDVAVFVQYAIAALAVGVLGLMTRSMGGVTRTHLPRLVGIGLIFAVGGLIFSASLAATNVAIASAVLMTEPIVLALLGYVINKERLTMAQNIALVVVVAGAVAATVG